MKKFSLSALVAAGLLVGGLSAGSASAADLGGNCCADLEERIAELEATTARKGNRKVSLTISGWVAEQVMWWDDGAESNVYVGGIGTTLASHFKLTGQATISPGWYAGFVIHIEAIDNEPLIWNQAGTGPLGGVNALQTYWFVKSDHMGKVSVGRQSQASDNAAILVDGSGSLVPANWVLFDNANFNLRLNNGALSTLTWGDIGYCSQIQAGIGGDCNGVPLNVVRYDSPTWNGFSVSASWGTDDMWDVAARYSGEWGGIKVAAVAAYSQSTNALNPVSSTNDLIIPGFFDVTVNSSGRQDTGYFQTGLYLQHVPTGLFVYGAWGQEQIDNSYFTSVSLNVFGSPLFGFGGLNTTNFLVPDDRPEHWYIKAGLREKWSHLGHTVLYGEYGHRENMINPQAISDTFVGATFTPGSTTGVLITGSESTQWGLGVVQEIDAAAMSMWLSYKHFDGSVDTTDLFGFNRSLNFDDMQILKFGALINF